MGRFKSTKVELSDGSIFDSKTEYAYWLILLGKQEQGLIWNLERQKPFLLQEAFKDKNGKAIRKMEYLSDMSYEDKDGKHIVDVKGSMYLIEETFKLKFKLCKFRFPEYTYHIIIKDKTKTWTDIENKEEIKAMKEREKSLPKKTKKKTSTKKSKTTNK